MEGSNSSFSNGSSQGHPVDYRVFLVCNACIVVVTCFGNLAILVAFAYNRDLTKTNKRINALIINLAVSDFFNGLIALPFYVIPQYVIPEGRNFPVVCVLMYVHVAHHYSIAVTMLTTLYIAIERYVAILHPFWEPGRCCACLLNTWSLLSITWLYPALLLAGLTLPGTLENSWDECDPNLRFANMHYPVLGIHLFIILGICSFCYAKIMFRARKSKKAMQSIAAQEYTEAGAKIPRTADTRKRKSTPSKYDISLAKTLLLLMVIFYVCFVPIGVKILVRLFDGKSGPQSVFLLNFEQFGIVFAMLSPCLDPFVYGWRNKQLRATIFDMFCCRRNQYGNRVNAVTSRQTESSDLTTEMPRSGTTILEDTPL